MTKNEIEKLLSEKLDDFIINLNNSVSTFEKYGKNGFAIIAINKDSMTINASSSDGATFKLDKIKDIAFTPNKIRMAVILTDHVFRSFVIRNRDLDGNFD